MTASIQIASPQVRPAIAELLQRLLPTRRSDVGSKFIFDIDPRIGADGFTIEDGIRITGHNDRALLYGVGKYLRTAGSWRGTSVPDKPVRGIYFATHFHNFYHEAPAAEIERYVEELALWGINSVLVWFDLHHFTGIGDPNARAMLARLNAVLNAAHRIGLDTGILVVPNAAYAGSPEPLRAKGGHRGAVYPEDLCVAHAESRELILKWFDEQLGTLTHLPDYLVLWPYDSGGCGCEKCRPWGANGFLSMSESIARASLKRSPGTKIILSTWFFDNDEWAHLAKAFRQRPDWIHYVMVDDFRTDRTEHPLNRGGPGGLPLLTFPEISMWGTGGWGPWGGYGASPFPNRVQELWDRIGSKVAGGFPYSEGFFEDMNKVVSAQLCWDSRVPSTDIIREYIAYEFSPEVVEAVGEVIQILEETLRRTGNDELRARKDKTTTPRFVIKQPERVRRAWELIQQAEAKLPPEARQRWRWRILYLRGLIDDELVRNDFVVSEHCEEALRELTTLYHAQIAASPVAPPTREALKANRPI